MLLKLLIIAFHKMPLYQKEPTSLTLTSPTSLSTVSRPHTSSTIKIITNRFLARLSPVSAIKANMVMERLEQQAPDTTTTSPRFCKRYVADVCPAIKPVQIDSPQSHLNSCQPSIQFTTETETLKKDSVISETSGHFKINFELFHWRNSNLYIYIEFYN